MHGSDYLPSYISMTDFNRAKVCTNINQTNWNLFKETLELVCRSGQPYHFFEQLVTSTITEVTRSFIVCMDDTPIDPEYEHLRAVHGREERLAQKKDIMTI